MIDEIKKRSVIVRNPLTVIAMFAGLAEVTAAIALPQLAEGVQKTFVWFVMGFPTLLVVLFFFVLWRKHHVLYAPSDFTDESNFMRHWVPAPENGEESDEAVEYSGEVDNETGSVSEDTQKDKPADRNFRGFLERAATAEKLVVSELSRKLGLSFATEVSLGREIGTRYDAVASGPSGPVIIEIKFLQHSASGIAALRRELHRAAALSYRLPSSELRKARLILAFVFETDAVLAEAARYRPRLRELRDAANLPMSVELEFYSLEQLQKGEPE